VLNLHSTTQVVSWLHAKVVVAFRQRLCGVNRPYENEINPNNLIFS
jgi:hypothetical protein